MQVAAWISVVLVGIVLIGQLSVPDTRDGTVGRRLRGLLGIALNALMEIGRASCRERVSDYV